MPPGRFLAGRFGSEGFRIGAGSSESARGRTEVAASLRTAWEDLASKTVASMDMSIFLAAKLHDG